MIFLQKKNNNYKTDVITAQSKQITKKYFDYLISIHLNFVFKT